MFAGLAWERASAEIDARGLLPASGASALGTVRSSGWAASIIPCARLGRAVLCAVGSVVGYQVSAATSRSGSAVAGAVGGRIGMDFPLGNLLAVRGYLDVLASIAPPTLEIDDRDAYSFPPASVDAGAAVFARF